MLEHKSVESLEASLIVTNNDTEEELSVSFIKTCLILSFYFVRLVENVCFNIFHHSSIK